MGRPRAVSFLVLVVPFPQLVGDHVEKAFRSHLRCGILAQRLCQGSVAPSSRSDVLRFPSVPATRSPGGLSPPDYHHAGRTKAKRPPRGAALRYWIGKGRGAGSGTTAPSLPSPLRYSPKDRLGRTCTIERSKCPL